MLIKILLGISISILLAVGGYAEGDSTAKSEKTASTSDAPKTTTRFVPNKDQIRQGQTILKDKKLYSGEATGTYNDETRAAIRVYQKDNGLTLSGNFNRATLEKMNIALTDKQKGIESTSSSTSSKTTKTSKSTSSTASAGDGPKKPAPFQANKDQIIALQKSLRDAKLYAGPQTGERSDELKEAVKKYQQANGLKATGGINAATLEKMGIALTDKQKANEAAQAAYDGAKKN